MRHRQRAHGRYRTASARRRRRRGRPRGAAHRGSAYRGVGRLRPRHGFDWQNPPSQPVHLPCVFARAGTERIGDGAGRLGAAAPGAWPDPADALPACVPMYLKSHSYGEYVFDWGWADAYERAGGRYYPKLLCAVPFTPVPGPRLLVAPDAPERRAYIWSPAWSSWRDRASCRHCTSISQSPRISRPSAGRVSARASASNSTGRMTATAISTTISPRSIPGSARRSRRSGARRWPAASKSTC